MNDAARAAPAGDRRRDLVLRSHDLAEIAGTTPRALRHYHQIGLLPEVPRDPNGYRRYSAQDLVRVLRIRQLAMSGMPLRRIGTVLQQDRHGQAEELAALDRELKEQADRIAKQREVIAALQGSAARPAWLADSHQPSATEQLDRDVWTVITASGGVDEASASAMQSALGESELAELASTWYPEFERLEGQTHVSREQADRLARQIVAFGDAVLEATGFTPANDGLPVAALIEQMQSDALSSAQQQVWKAFLALVGDDDPASASPAS